jgi:hypothetical protein
MYMFNSSSQYTPSALSRYPFRFSTPIFVTLDELHETRALITAPRSPKG